ncbi:MAG: 2'-5' RNA ligase family protein [Burkholderiaceae bacterium]
MPAGQRAPNENIFFALLPDDTEIQRLTSEATQCMLSAGLTVRRTDVTRLHVTLAFLGTGLDNRKLSAACWAADQVHLPAFDVRFDRAMSFGRSNGPFVLTGRIDDDDLAPVYGLRTALIHALADQGIRLKAAYRPHMTLSYSRRPHVAEHAITPIAFPGRAFHLMRSHAGQSRHERLASWPLADSPAR